MKKPLTTRRTVIRDLAGLLFLVILLGLSSMGASVYYLAGEGADSDLIRLADYFTRHVADDLSGPLSKGNRAALKEAAEVALRFPTVDGLTVFDANGAVLYRQKEVVRGDNDTWTCLADVTAGRRPLGRIEVNFSGEFRTVLRQRIILVTSLAIVLLSGLAVLFTILLLRVRLSRPLVLIRRAVEEIAGGRYETRLPALPLADLNAVAEGVNAMARQISSRAENLSAEVAARREAAALLAETEERHQAVLEAMPDAVLIHDMAGRLLYLNPAFTGLFGWTLPEGQARSLADLLAEDEPRVFKNLPERLVAGEVVARRSTSLMTRDRSSAVPVSVSAAAYRDPGGKPLGCVIHIEDQRERKSLEAQLLHAQKMQAVGTLAAGVAHDMNNLFMGIQGYTSLMQLTADRASPSYGQTMDRLARIEQCVTTGASLTRQLLGMSRGGKYAVKSLDLNALVRDQNALFNRSHKDLTISGEYRQDLWRVKGDRSQLELVILNLYTNAWQSMNEGGTLMVRTGNAVIDEAAAKAHEVRPGPYAKLSVTDTGTGMDEATRERIFEPFFTTKDMGRGTGLGLWSTYGIVRNHEGFITVESTPGRGSAFTVFLPAADEEGLPETKAPDEIVPGTETILLVDDEEIILDVGKDILENMGYAVHTASGGKEALAVAAELGGGIDLVILDMVMPEMSGRETFAAIKKMLPGVRTLLASGYSRDGQAQEILDQGCDGFIQKPFNMRELSSRIREVLSK